MIITHWQNQKIRRDLEKSLRLHKFKHSFQDYRKSIDSKIKGASPQSEKYRREIFKSHLKKHFIYKLKSIFILIILYRLLLLHVAESYTCLSNLTEQAFIYQLK